MLTAAQLRAADQYTIANEPISSIDLMERAAAAFTTRLQSLYPDTQTPMLVCCGTGNNGGDGLAVARLLQLAGYDSVAVWVIRFSTNESDDFAKNLTRLYQTPVPVTVLYPKDTLPPITQTVVVDALLGSGLNRPLKDEWLRIVHHINHSQKNLIAVDIPTGMYADGFDSNT